MKKIKEWCDDHFGLTCIMGFIVAAIILTYVLYLIMRTTCLQSYSNYQPQFGFFSQCRIEWNGKLTPTDIIYSINK